MFNPQSLLHSLIFIAVVEEGNFKKASVKLNMTKAGVSYAIKALEKKIGLVLVIRVNTSTGDNPGRTQRLSITENGEHFYNLSKELFILLQKYNARYIHGPFKQQDREGDKSL